MNEWLKGNNTERNLKLNHQQNWSKSLNALLHDDFL